jgi:hypothetical protein
MNQHCRLLWLGLVLIIALSSCGVQASGQPLQFQTLAQDSILRSNPKDETPMVRIIATAQEIDQLMHQFGDPPPLQIAPQLVNQLHQFNYNSSFAVLVTQGQTGPHGFRVTIQQITRQDDRVMVQSQFIGPKPGEGQPMVSPDPYHLVAVSKEGAWARQIQFELVANGKTVAEATHFI